MRLVSGPIGVPSASEGGGGAGVPLRRRLERHVRYAVRLVVGLFVGAVLGPYVQRGLASVSLAFVVPLALATLAVGLFGLAAARTVRDLRRGHGVLRQD
jgi:hypothetical protein